MSWENIAYKNVYRREQVDSGEANELALSYF
jgi:hypothetical protein